MRKFTSTKDYVTTPDLELAVNSAITLEKPLLVKGEPGTGKTLLAEEISKALDTEIIKWHIVLLIDEIDKADIEFPNDLLQELDRMEFYVYETKENIIAKNRPIVIITSNNEKELPDAFLRRCIFHYINFPSKKTMEEIVNVHFPKIKKKLLSEALSVFFDLREVPNLKKYPSTSELIDWIKLLLSDDIPREILLERDQTKAIPPLHGALLKNEQDVQMLERLRFMLRREN